MTTTSLVVAAEPSDVWGVLAGGLCDARAVVAESADRAAGRGAAVATGVDHRHWAGLLQLDGTIHVVEADEPSRLHLRASGGPSGAREVVFELRPVDGGTSVILRADALAGASRRDERVLRTRHAELLWRLAALVGERTGHVGEGPTPRRLPAPVGRVVVRSFARLAALRHRQALHPRGALFTGTAVLHDGGRALAGDRDVGVIVRMSRGIGLPHPLPDFNGVAVRFVDAHGRGRHQDLLFTAAGSAPVLRQLILPLPTLDASGYSTVLTYREGGGRRLFRCAPIPSRTLVEARRTLPLTLELLSASPLGRWSPAATVTLTASPSEDDRSVRFDPWNTGDGLTPAGLLNRLRAPAYAGSRAAAP